VRKKENKEKEREGLNVMRVEECELFLGSLKCILPTHLAIVFTLSFPR